MQREVPLEVGMRELGIARVVDHDPNNDRRNRRVATMAKGLSEKRPTNLRRNDVLVVVLFHGDESSHVGLEKDGERAQDSRRAVDGFVDSTNVVTRETSQIGVHVIQISPSNIHVLVPFVIHRGGMREKDSSHQRRRSSVADGFVKRERPELGRLGDATRSSSRTRRGAVWFRCDFLRLRTRGEVRGRSPQRPPVRSWRTPQK